MSSHQSRRAARGTAEQMLRAAAGVTSDEAEALVALFAAAAAGPSCPDELAGETAAVAAFRSARHSPTSITRRVPTMKRSLAALLTVKTAAAALVVTSMGGVALAATGVPLNSLADGPGKSHAQQAAHAEEKLAKEAAKNAAKTAKASDKLADAAERDAQKAAKEAAKAAEKAAVLSPANFHGLCNAVAAGAWDNPGKAQESTAFQRLIAAAALAQQSVTDYCADLPAETEVPAEQTAAEDTATEDTAGEAKVKGKSAQAHERKSAPHGKSADAPGHAADKPGKAHDQQVTHDAEKAAKADARDEAKDARTAEKDAKKAAAKS